MKCDMIYVYILIKMWYIYELSSARADTVKEMKYHIMYKVRHLVTLLVELKKI